MIKTHLSLASFCLLLASCSSTTPHESTTTGQHEVIVEKPFEFVIVQLNDVYEISPLDGGRVGGLARVAAVIEHLKEKNPNTITVLAGDFLSPSLISSLSEEVNGERKRIAGEHIVAVLNAMGLDYTTFGNHEFDVSPEDLQERIDESEFSYVSSNVLFQPEGEAPRPFVQRGRSIPRVATHTFTTPAGGEIKLGLIALTLPFNLAPYVRYEDIYESGRSAFEAARADHDIVFALTHLAMEEDERLARTVPELPFIIGGHEHSDSLATVGNTIIAKADANARTIYIHWVTYHPESEDVEIWSQLMPITSDLKSERHTAEVAASWEAKADALIAGMGYDANDVLTSLPGSFDGREEMIRNYQTNLGRLVACAMLDADTAAEFAFINSGSIRIDDMLSGEIRQRDILRTLPFGGSVVHGAFKGSVLQKILDAGFVANRDAGGYFQTTGNVVITDDSYSINGESIDRDAEYEAVLPEFLSLGLEENLDFMDEEGRYAQIAGAEYANLDIRNLVIQYLKKPDWMNTCSFAGVAMR